MTRTSGEPVSASPADDRRRSRTRSSTSCCVRSCAASRARSTSRSGCGSCSTRSSRWRPTCRWTACWPGSSRSRGRWWTRSTPRWACSDVGARRPAADVRPPRDARRRRSPRSATCPRGTACSGQIIVQPAAAAAPRHRRASGLLRLPAAPPADELVPGRPRADPRPGLRQPLPDREGRRHRLHRGGRGDRGRARRCGRRRHRERATLRGVRAATAMARRPRPRSPPSSPASAPEDDALQLIADRAREVADADVAWVVAGQNPQELTLRVVSGVDVDIDVLRDAPDGALAVAEVADDEQRHVGAGPDRRPEVDPGVGRAGVAAPRARRRGPARRGHERRAGPRLDAATTPTPIATSGSCCRPASRSRSASRCSSPGAGATSSDSRCSRIATGSVATCTTSSSSGCSRWASRLQGTARLVENRGRRGPPGAGGRRPRRHDQGHPSHDLLPRRARVVRRPAVRGDAGGRAIGIGDEAAAHAALRRSGAQRHRRRADRGPARGAERGADQRQPGTRARPR